MAITITYTNRRGQTYFLHQGKTKTGKDKFFVSMKTDGELAERLPEDFEIYENPNAQVFVRKRLDSLIQAEELEIVQQTLASQPHLHSYDYKVDYDRKSITVHLINENPKEIITYLAPHKANEQNYEDYAHRSGTYSPMMRFILRDEKKRLFTVERFCFKGSVDDWIYLTGPDSLKPLASKFLKHIGKESFFDLM